MTSSASWSASRIRCSAPESRPRRFGEIWPKTQNRSTVREGVLRLRFSNRLRWRQVRGYCAPLPPASGGSPLIHGPPNAM